MPYPTASPATWFVTGASRGLGLELVTQLLERGDNVAATTRSTARLTAALDGPDTSRLLALEVDLADRSQVADAITAAKDRFGGLDVVVNNAGYGLLAAVEEVTDADARALFDVQVFGVWNVLRAVLPDFREARSGHILNISSILGLTTFPGWSVYCAGKYALEALTESLAAEVRDHGIKVNLIEPGYTRTDFLQPHSLRLPTAPSDAYPAVREMTEQHLAMSGTQLGDPPRPPPRSSRSPSPAPPRSTRSSDRTPTASRRRASRASPATSRPHTPSPSPPTSRTDAGWGASIMVRAHVMSPGWVRARWSQSRASSGGAAARQAVMSSSSSGTGSWAAACTRHAVASRCMRATAIPGSVPVVTAPLPRRIIASCSPRVAAAAVASSAVRSSRGTGWTGTRRPSQAAWPCSGASSVRSAPMASVSSGWALAVAATSGRAR